TSQCCPLNPGSQLSHGSCAVHKTAENRGDIQSACSVNTQQDVVHESNAGNRNHADPGVAGIEQTPGIDVVVRKDGIDDKSNQSQQHGAANLMRLKVSGEAAELGLPGEKHGHHNCACDRSKNMSFSNQNAQQIVGD